jgi:hypothetical protein
MFATSLGGAGHGMLVAMATQLAGWIGSALVIVSLKQKDPTRFRVLNLVASALLAVFTLVVHAWPSFTVNALSVAVNAHELWMMRRRAERELALERTLDLELHPSTI